MLNCLLMTGTIVPPSDAPVLERVDPDARIGDYRRALAFNIEQLEAGAIDRIVFTENSGYGMAPFEEMTAKSRKAEAIELLSYDGMSGTKGISRFCGETRLMHWSLENSQLIRQLSDDDRIWKVTGRYLVKNLKPIVANAPGEGDLFFHCRNRPLAFIDYGFVGIRKGIAGAYLSEVMELPRFEEIGEAHLRQSIDAGGFSDFKIVPRLARVPDFSGVRGYDQASYDGLSYRLKFLFRSVAHRMVPSLWI